MNLAKNIEDYELIFLDLETTGLDVVTGDSICEIGAFKVKNREIIDEFHSLVNPRKVMPPQAYKVHKISDQELKDAPYFEDIADKLILFLNNSIICAYNVGFDVGFVNYQLQRMNRKPLVLPTVDILSMARDLLELPRYNLAATAKFLGVDCSQGLHRALSDALVTYRVSLKLIDILKEKKIEKLDEFVSLYGLNNDMLRSRENKKIDFFKKAVDNRETIEMKYFSVANIIKEEAVLPLRVFHEGKHCYLLCQGKGENSSRIRLNRIFNIKTVKNG